MNYKTLNIVNDGFVLETFINKKSEIAISIRYEDSSIEVGGNIISLDFDDAVALRDELNILLEELNGSDE